jgi:hypothetical protein
MMWIIDCKQKNHGRFLMTAVRSNSEMQPVTSIKSASGTRIRLVQIFFFGEKIDFLYHMRNDKSSGLQIQMATYPELGLTLLTGRNWSTGVLAENTGNVFSPS